MDYVQCAENYYKEMADKQEKQERLIDGMYEAREEALTLIQGFVHPSIANDLAELISFATDDEVCIRISNKMKLKKHHICALAEDLGKWEEHELEETIDSYIRSQYD